MNRNSRQDLAQQSYSETEHFRNESDLKEKES